MKTEKAIRNSLSMVSPRVKVIVFTTAIGRMSSSILDLLGVLALGLFTASTVGNEITSNSKIDFIFRFIGIEILEKKSYSLIAAIALFLLKSLMSFSLSLILAKTLYKESFKVTKSVVENVALADLERIYSRPSQEQHYILTSGVKATIFGILNNFVSILSDTFLILIFIATLFFASPLATAYIILILGSVGVLVYRIVSMKLYAAGQNIGSRSIHSNIFFQESVHGFRELKVSGRLNSHLKKFFSAEKELGEAQVTQVSAALIPRYVMESSVMISLGVIAGVAFATQEQSQAIVTITLFVAATARILPAIVPLQTSLGDLKANSGLASNFYKFIEEITEEKDPKTIKPKRVFDYEKEDYLQDSAQIKISKLSFMYKSPPKIAISNLNLELKGPSWIAIVGASGSGKSTIFDLIMGLRLPQTGTVAINGNCANEFIFSNPEYCTYIPQRLTLANASLAENVAFGVELESIDSARVSNALEQVGLTEVVERHHSGIWQKIGEHGSNFSGGQSQRLGLARAIYSRPKILLLDESTSNLDSLTEKILTEEIRRISKETLVISISHRVESLENVDRIILIESGHVSFDGSYSKFRLLNKEIE